MAKKNKYLHAPTNEDLERMSNGERLSDIRATPFKKAINGALNEEIEEIVEPSLEDSKFKRKRSRQTRRHIYLFIGVFVTFMSIIGTISATKYAINWFKKVSDNSVQKQELERYIYPLTMIDVPTFSDSSKLTDDIIIKACGWSFIMNFSDDSFKVQDDYFIVPQSDFEARAKKMFGDNVQIKKHNSILDPICTFLYDSANKSYNLPLNPTSVASYRPKIEKITNSPSNADILILRVGYYLPTQEWLPEDKKNIASKYFNYIVKKNGFSYNILAVEDSNATNSSNNDIDEDISQELPSEADSVTDSVTESQDSTTSDVESSDEQSTQSDSAQ